MPKMRKIQVLLFVLYVLTQTGCAVMHPGTESAFSVKGRILTNDSLPPASCQLDVYKKKGERLVKRLDVLPQFERQVVIGPGIHEYYMVISCPGNPTKFKTGIYKLGSTYYLDHPVDLGEVDLRGGQ